MLTPSTITARRTRRYTSTLYIRCTTRRLDFKPMDGGGRSDSQPPFVSDHPPMWPTLSPPFTLSTFAIDLTKEAVAAMLKPRFETSNNACQARCVGRTVMAMAMLLLVIAALLVIPGFAEAQDPDTIDLVGNIDEDAHDTAVVNSSFPGYATSFTTADNGGGYTMKEVNIRIGGFRGSDNVQVSVYTNASGIPGATEHTLTYPGTLPTSSSPVTTFTAPDNAVLLANTTYWVVVDRVAGSFTYSRTDETDEDGLDDWTIGDTSRRRTGDWSSSSTQTRHLRMLVRGYANSTDATEPVLAEARMFSAGNLISLDYNESLDGSSDAFPERGAFTLMVAGVEAPVSIVFSAERFPARVLLIPRTRIFQGQEVKLTYSDPTTADDEMAIQDLAGNDAASFTDRLATNESIRNDIVPTIKATPRGPNSIWLEWDLPEGVDEDEITSYRIEHSDDFGQSWNDLVDYTGDRTSLRYTMHRGLRPATDYT